MQPDSQKPPAPALPKKPYQAPSLERYGDLREITQALNTTGAKNDGGHGNNKT
jgi:hypothetical protein